jgi:pyruvate formate lyase activating enzyme
MKASGGIVFDIQRYSLHDGPGLRTNVFLKGCNLKCRWCSNPESQYAQPEIAFFERICFTCGDCVPLCKPGAIQQMGEKITWDRARCSQCFDCAGACTSRAFSVIGKEMTPEEVLAEVRRDMPFYMDGGGLTLTGGEPALQANFAGAILEQAHQAGIQTAIETCGAVPWENYGKLLPNLDLVLFDFKHIDPEIHQQFTGKTNHRILENLKKIDDQEDIKLIVRIPLIPGFNADAATLKAMAGFLNSLKRVEEVHLLGYHSLGRPKYHALGIPYVYEGLPPMPEAETESWADIFRQHGFLASVGG